MDKRSVTICDHTFLEHTKSASLGGGNIDLEPINFRWEYADAMTARFVTDGDIKHARGYGQVAWLLEPYGLHPENYREAWERQDEFDAILLHSHQEIFGGLWYPYGGSWIPFEKWGTKYEKDKNISMILSDKDTMPGHKLRHRCAQLLGNNGLVDVFYHFPDKLDALANYRFSIVIESERAPQYFTEKLIDCLCVGTIPIYWGTPDVDNFFDPLGILSVGTFAGIEELVSLIHGNDGMTYWQRGNVLSENVERCHKYAICEDSIYEMHPELFE